MICCNFFNSWALMLLFVGTGEEMCLQHVVEASAVVSVGDTEEVVEQVLGEPQYKWPAGPAFLFGTRPAQWIYGTTIDLDFLILGSIPVPNPLPLKLRIFGADPKDLVIEWTEDQKVASVTRPKLNYPQEIIEESNALQVAFDLCNAFAIMIDPETLSDGVKSDSD